MTSQQLWPNHIFVCANQRDEEHPRPCCGEAHGAQVRDWFKQLIKKRGLATSVRASRSGCLEACEAGPAIVVYPQGVWYRVLTKADVERILDEHIIGGEIVTPLLLDMECLPAWKARQQKQTANS